MEYHFEKLTQQVIAAAIEVHQAQLLTYLRLLPAKVRLILNFHEARLKDGICRLVC